MKLYITEKIESDVLMAIECDRCKKFYDEPYDMQEFLCLNFHGGYYSVFGDLVQVEADICQNCLKEMIEAFCRIKEIDFS